MNSEATRRSFLKTAGASLLAGLPASKSRGSEDSPNEDPQPGRKKLIAWGGIDWYSPEKVQNNIRAIEELPFDGTVLQGFSLNRDNQNAKKPVEMFDWFCFGKRRFDRKQLSSTISVLKDIRFERFTDNLLRFNVTPGDVDWFDDFGSILHNARMWAEVTRETGMKGWLFDIEDYKGTVFNYAKMKHRKKHSFEDYARQARQRGQEFMGAVQDSFPEITLLLVLAHSYVNRTPNAATKLPQLDYGLVPAFLNGMLEKAGPRVRIIDGQEQSYGYLTSEDYFRGYHSARKQALDLVPTDLHNTYRARMDIGTAVYVNYALQLKGAAVGPHRFLTQEDLLQQFEHNIYYALKTADEYVWCYGERIGWWEKGYPVALPDGALAAIRSARAKYEQNRPLALT